MKRSRNCLYTTSYDIRNWDPATGGPYNVGSRPVTPNNPAVLQSAETTWIYWTNQLLETCNIYLTLITSRYQKIRRLCAHYLSNWIPSQNVVCVFSTSLNIHRHRRKRLFSLVLLRACHFTNRDSGWQPHHYFEITSFDRTGTSTSVFSPAMRSSLRNYAWKLSVRFCVTARGPAWAWCCLPSSVCLSHLPAITIMFHLLCSTVQVLRWVVCFRNNELLEAGGRLTSCQHGLVMADVFGGQRWTHADGERRQR